MKSNNCPDCKVFEQTYTDRDICLDCIKDIRKPKGMFLFDGSLSNSTSVTNGDFNIIYTIDKISSNV